MIGGAAHQLDAQLRRTQSAPRLGHKNSLFPEREREGNIKGAKAEASGSSGYNRLRFLPKCLQNLRLSTVSALVWRRARCQQQVSAGARGTCRSRRDALQETRAPGACEAGLSRPPGYCFGVVKSQAVSWAHFHMARMSRVNPMSLGFSKPLMSRCFIMATNSLLLSSPFPG